MSRRRKQKLPQDPVAAEIRALSHDGRGIAAIEGKTTFIRGALPGEQVMFRYTSRRGSFDEGLVTDIIQASPDRVEPPCQHADICGGCSLQHMATDVQIAHKQQSLLEMLRNIGKVEAEEVLAPLTGEKLGYRRKARMGVRHVAKKGGMLIGFREKQNPRLLANIDSCAVLHPSVGQLLTPLKDVISKLSTFEGIAQIEVAISDEDTALIFRHLEDLNKDDYALLVDFAITHDLHIYLQPGNMDSVHRIWPESGEPILSYRLPDFDVQFQFRPTDFTQVNTGINRKMVALAIELLAPTADDTVLDLFCGIGNFSLPLARRAGSVVGIEGADAMVKRASQNAALNQITNTQFLAADLESDQLIDLLGQQQFAKILLDPPRSGAAGVIPQLAKLDAKRIVYVSCNPATLARDAGELVHQLGYRLSKVGIMDMFPHTAHVESIAVFDKQ